MEWAEVILSLIQSLGNTSNYHNGSYDNAFLRSIAHKVISDVLKNKHTEDLDNKVSPFSIQSNYFGSK